MRFGILGPLRIRVGETDTTLAAGRERTVLAVLLLYPNEVVPVERLADAVWGSAPPSTMRAQVHSCVSRLRRALREKGIEDKVIATDPAGYVVRVDADDLDSLVFARRVAEGREAAAAGRLEEARAQLRAALALWRGPALAGIGSRQVEIGASGLEEQHSTAVEDCVDLELRLGLAQELLGELTDLVERFPVRERLRGQLMIALYRAGRQADALAVYRQGREALAEELGLEPGPHLEELHRRILNRDPDLLGAPREQPGPAARPAPRHGLPRDVVDFTGRDEWIARLLSLVPADPSDGPATPVIQVIDGMAGTGKTSLAVHVAHLVAERYPDAQLYIDLHGHSDRAPTAPVAALDVLLRQLGIPAEGIPERLDERMTVWRTELASRRALVVLDNAADSAQVLPLLPGGARALALVTSRRRLSGLDGVHHFSLDVLDPVEAMRLLVRVAGDRVEANPAAAAQVARLCGYLPLALRLAAARLVHRRSWTAADLADRLRRTRIPLAELAVEGRTVSAAFALSYQHLDETGRRVFRLLGLHPPNSFDARAVAALAHIDPDAAQDVLEDLVDAHLVEAPTAHRYRLHDLLHEYARELSAADDLAAERHDVTTRMLDHYLYATAEATAFLESAHLREGLDPPDGTRRVLELADQAEALAWLEHELANVVTCIRVAAELGRSRVVCKLARALWVYLWRHGYTAELIETYELALAAARQLDDEAAIASAHNYVASGYFRQGRWADVVTHLQQALEARRRLDDKLGQASTLGNLASVYRRLGRYAEAVEHIQQQLALAGEVGPDLPSRPLANLGSVYMVLGRYEEALEQHRQDLAASRRTGSRYGEGLALGDLGVVHLRLGHLTVAVALLKRAVQLKSEQGNRYGSAETLSDLGSAYRGLGRQAEAIAVQRQALAEMRAVGDLAGECQVLNDLATTLTAAGATAEARELHGLALARTEDVVDRYERARAHDGLGAAWEGTDPVRAREHWEIALALFTELGVPERADVERRLADLGAGRRAARPLMITEFFPGQGTGKTS
ncbi:AfsR/SARP family transcriptional regulator [Planosporangium mesophilum]|uniref:SARP family transcriptional regulator n=1 Tax=Planosporangium mesophilum TaxID=689768 RepID=A0A8J3TDV4_9ACTN|nr:BTAD domain-containing putative transcriptional regulator [Planosporangium mesophilum]NJC83666.1 tetratricopeptide repeat protein [Planosporangium mesophilum]GII25330.1 SARP family transcriptional regulator [Planosporangium mesophilum]